MQYNLVNIPYTFRAMVFTLVSSNRNIKLPQTALLVNKRNIYIYFTIWQLDALDLHAAMLRFL